MKNEIVERVRDSLTPTVSIVAAKDLPGGRVSFEVRQEYKGLPWDCPLANTVYVHTDAEGKILVVRGLL